MFNKLFKLQENVLKALAHSRRLEIIHLLRDQELTVSEIYTMLDLPQANVSQHLQILKEQKIVKTNKKGKQIIYRLSSPEYLNIADIVRELLVNQFSSKDLDIDINSIVPLTHDPVCDMRISPKTAGFVYKHDGSNYYFCASGCLEKFKKDPMEYLKK